MTKYAISLDFIIFRDTKFADSESLSIFSFGKNHIQEYFLF